MNVHDRITADSPHDLSDVPNSLTELIDFLEHVEHPYLREALGHLEERLEEAFRAEEGRHADVLEVLRGEVARLMSDLLTHMSEEEKKLLPRARRLVAAAEEPEPDQISLTDLISPFQHDHENAIDHVERVRRTTGDFYTPTEAGPAFRKAYEEFEDFDRRLQRHVWIEENLLVPAILECQKQIEEENENV
jgi:regulator of cell morphogenesis and NO signaling